MMHTLFLSFFIITIICSIHSAHGMEVPTKTELRGPAKSNQNVAIFQYLDANDIEMVESLLKKGGINVNYKNILCMTLLHVASDNKNQKAMQLLLDHGADIAIEKPQMHPIFEAVYRGEEETVAWWLKSGVNPNIKLPSGITPIYVASYEGHTAIVASLLNAEANADLSGFNGYRPLQIAAYHGYTALAKLLLQQTTIDINHKLTDGGTAIYLASQKGCIEIVRMLIAKKANVNLTDDKKKSPLTVALDNNFVDIGILLIDNGANVNCKTENGCTAIYKASKRGQINIVQMLINKKADINLTDNNEQSALYTAIVNKQTDTATLLINSGADVNIVPGHGQSALIQAIYFELTDLSILLINAGANIHQKTTNGEWTPLCLASYNGMTNLVKLLLKKGADINHKLSADSIVDSIIKKGDTALTIARKKRHHDVVERFLKYTDTATANPDAETTSLLHIQKEDSDKKNTNDENCIIC